MAGCLRRAADARHTDQAAQSPQIVPPDPLVSRPSADRHQPSGGCGQRLLTALSDCRLGHGIRMHMAQVDGPVNRLLAGEAASIGDARAFYEDTWTRPPSIGRPAGRPAGLLLQDTAQVPAEVLAESEEIGAVSFQITRPTSGTIPPLSGF